MNNEIKVYDGNQIRTAWDNEKEELYFSIVDVVGALSESKDAASYWRKLKQRLRNEGNQTVTNCHGLKMKAADGKYRLTDVANTEELLRIIQSIPSKKAEPFKMWLAEVGRERIDEIVDPEIAIDRALETYARKGYDADWINQRLLTIRARNELTDEWQAHGVQKGVEFAILTDEITKAWSGMTTREFKDFKGLKKESLRDNMTSIEIALNMLAETATKEITSASNPHGFKENKDIAAKGGSIAGNARKELEKETGKNVITQKNDVDLGKLIGNIITDTFENN